jgi:hypothetical protein
MQLRFTTAVTEKINFNNFMILHFWIILHFWFSLHLCVSVIKRPPEFDIICSPPLTLIIPKL